MILENEIKQSHIYTIRKPGNKTTVSPYRADSVLCSVRDIQQAKKSRSTWAQGNARPKIISVSETWYTYAHFYPPPPPPPWTGTLVYERVKPRSMLPKASYTAESRVALIQPFESRLGRTWRSEIAEKGAVSSLQGVCLVHSPLTCSPLW